MKNKSLKVLLVVLVAIAVNACEDSTRIDGSEIKTAIYFCEKELNSHLVWIKGDIDGSTLFHCEGHTKEIHAVYGGSRVVPKIMTLKEAQYIITNKVISN